MKVEYADNKDLGAGNGLFVFSEVIPPEGPWSISLKRASDQKFLTGNKSNLWVGENFFIQLPGNLSDSGQLELKASPSIVNALDMQEQYKITLKGADGEPISGRLKVGAITYSPVGSLDNTADAPPAPEPEPVYAPEPASQENAVTESGSQPQRTDAQPEGNYDQAASTQYQDDQYPDGQYQQGQHPVGQYQEGGYADGQYQEGGYADGQYQEGYYQEGQYPGGQYPQEYAPEQYQQEGEIPAQTDGQGMGQEALRMQPPFQPAQQGQKKSRLGLWIFLILLLAALGAGGWFGWPYIKGYLGFGDEAPVADKSGSAPETQAEKRAPVAKAPASPGSAQSSSEQVGMFFQGQNITPKAAAELAARLPRTTPADQDAIYRLYYFAAENDEPGAIMEYAAVLDPAKPKFGTISKDAVLAYEAYQKGVRANLNGARSAIDNMLQWLNSQAQSGNEQARIWLEQIGK